MMKSAWDFLAMLSRPFMLFCRLRLKVARRRVEF